MDGSAAAGDVYAAAGGMLNFNPGETQKSVTVAVNGDTDFEGDETFLLNLSNATGGAVISDRQGVGAITNDDIVTPPPRVTAVWVGGTSWTASFRNFLAARGMGDATFGYAVPAGPGQLDELPWGNVNQFSIRFDKDVLVLDLDGSADGVVDNAAAALDGDWGGVADTFPSGDGTAGGDFRFRLNLLNGDANRDGRTNGIDWIDLRRRLRRSTPAPGAGVTGYTVFHDLTADGVIGTPDMLVIRRNLLQTLPSTEPGAATAAARAALPTAAMFSTRRIRPDSITSYLRA